MCKTTKGGQTAKTSDVGKAQSNGSLPTDPTPPPPTPPPTPPPLTTPTPPGSTLDPQLATAATAFKAAFDNNNASYHFNGGQFAVLATFQTDLVARIFDINDTALRSELIKLAREEGGWSSLRDSLLSSNVRIGDKYQKSLSAGDPDKGKPVGALRSLSIVNNTTQYKRATATARQLMAAASVSTADRAIASALLDDATGTGEWGASSHFGWFAKSKLGPIQFDKVSLPRQCALYLFSIVGCGSTAQFTGRQLMNTQGISPASLPSFSPVTLTSLGQTDVRRSTPGNLILKYDNTKLQAAVAAAKLVLSAGGYIVAGCLSGKDHESFHPAIEHYILLFAALQKTFLFWDPDVSVTSIAALSSQLSPGIGVLTLDDSDSSASTFSTGADFSDLSSIWSDTGHHVQNPRRHRYQIMTLAKA